MQEEKAQLEAFRLARLVSDASQTPSQNRCLFLLR